MATLAEAIAYGWLFHKKGCLCHSCVLKRHSDLTKRLKEHRQSKENCSAADSESPDIDDDPVWGRCVLDL